MWISQHLSEHHLTHWVERESSTCNKQLKLVENMSCGVHKWASNLRLSSYFIGVSIFVLAFLWCAEERYWFVYKQTIGNANFVQYARNCTDIFGRSKRIGADITRQTTFRCGSNSWRALIPMHSCVITTLQKIEALAMRPLIS